MLWLGLVVSLLGFCEIFAFLFFVVDPRLTDYDTLLDNLHGLKDGKSVQVPIYDFKSSSRIGYRYWFSHLTLLKKFLIDCIIVEKVYYTNVFIPPSYYYSSLHLLVIYTK